MSSKQPSAPVEDDDVRKARLLRERQAHARQKKQAAQQAAQQPAPTTTAPPQRVTEPEPRPSLFRSLSASAVLVFLGSLLGTLLGTVTSVNDLFDSVNRIQALIDPPTRLCVAGSNTILGTGLGMAAQWEQGFEARHDNVDVVIRGVGSITGVEEAAAGDCVHVLAMSEAMPNASERLLAENNVTIECAAEIGYDVIAFVTDANNDLAALLERLMSNVLTGRATNWDDVRGQDQPIYIYVRRGSGTTDVILKSFGWQLGDRELPPNANYLECASNSDCLDKTLSTPGSLYWVSTSWMRTQPPEYLRVLPILSGDERPINPLVDEFSVREYPNELVRPLYMYVVDNQQGADPAVQALARDFLRYVRGVDGQQILEDSFFYNHFNQPRAVPLEFPNGFEVTTSGPREVCRAAI